MRPQEFSDNEEEVEESLAPLPDEGDAGEGDEEAEQDEAAGVTTIQPEPDPAEATATQEDIISKPPSPGPQLSMNLENSSELSIGRPDDTLDASLNPLDVDMGVGVALTEKDGIDLDISALGPDGLPLEGSHDLSQIEQSDALMGGPMMEDESEDPFVGQ